MRKPPGGRVLRKSRLRKKYSRGLLRSLANMLSTNRSEARILARYFCNLPVNQIVDISCVSNQELAS